MSPDGVPPDPGGQPRFKLGDRLRLKADPSRSGYVVEAPRRYPGGYEYLVVIGGREEWYSEEALEATPAANVPRWESRDELLRDILLAKLANPLTDSLYAYRASRTEYQPYQFRPALKFLRSPQQSLLIADEVGLGKTIEAAIIYLELKARLDISRVLVLCPARLTSKWQEELRNRFEEEFDVLDAPKVRQFLDDDLRVTHAVPIRAIASFELLRREEFLDRLTAQNIPLDLLIIDEAHHLRNSDTQTYRLGNVLVNTSDAVLFLTATPLHLGNQDLFNLLNLLAPDEFDNRQLFDEVVRPNRHLNRASQLLAAGKQCEAWDELRKVEQTQLRDRYLHNPYYQDVCARLAGTDGMLTLEERVELQRELAELNTLASVFTRTRKREVEHAAQRAAFTIRVTLTEAERAFYDAVVQHARREARAAGPGAIGFAAIMKERQAASCLAALRQALENASRHRVATSLRVERSPFDVHGTDDEPRIAAATDLLGLARSIGPIDSKFERFREALDKALAEDPSSKALVFSFFRGTLEYLRRQLAQAHYEVGMIHGDVKIEDRRRIIEEFRTRRDFRILLSSEVGAEGLDFQFCDVLVNYDLPWNPMQVEQRIGRLDRFGQEHPRIRIYNFYIEDTIETRIFQRLYDRIELFSHSIGDLEAILGEEITELSRRVLQSDLTPEEEVRLADQAAERIVRRQREEEELERHKDELLGQGRILDQQVDAAVNSGRIISPEEVRALVFTFLEQRFPRTRLIGDEEEPCWILEFDLELAEYLRKFIELHRLHSRTGPKLRAALVERGRLPLTFDSEYARKRANLEFITVRHPLAEAARAHWADLGQTGVPASTVVVSGPPEEAGDGYFFIYVHDVRGVVERVTLEPVIVLESGGLALRTAEQLLRQLQQGGRAPDALPHDQAIFSEAERQAAAHVAQRRDALERDTRRRNEALLAARSTSIRASFQAKIRRAEELLWQVHDPRIRRLREGQIRHLRTRMEQKLQDLERGRNVTVSSRLIAGGRIRVEPAGERTAPALPIVVRPPSDALSLERERRVSEPAITGPSSPPTPEKKTDRRSAASLLQRLLNWLRRG